MSAEWLRQGSLLSKAASPSLPGVAVQGISEQRHSRDTGQREGRDPGLKG